MSPTSEGFYTAPVPTAFALSADRSGEIESQTGGVHSITRGRTNSEDRLKVRAFEMFVQDDLTFGEIARELGCSKQYLYKYAKDHNWVEKKAKVQRTVLMNYDLNNEAIQEAIASLRTKLHQRIMELNKLCEGGNLKAIVEWLRMAGVDPKVVDEMRAKPPQEVGVYNDLSDRRQITVLHEVEPRPVVPDGKNVTPEGTEVAQTATGGD